MVADNNVTLSLSKGMIQTEIGLIPEDWEMKELCEILKFGSGKDYKHLSKGNIPVYGTGGLMTMVNDFLYDGESVGIGRKGTIDKPVFLNGKFWTVDTLFFTHSFNNSHPKFVYYQFNRIPWREYNEASGVPSLNKNTLELIQIPLPPLPEQQAIAEALSDADAWIESLEKLIAKKRLIKQGAMQVLLTPKEDWEELTIFEVADKKRDLFNDGDWIEAVHIKNEGIRLIQTGNIGIGTFLNKQNKKYINEKSFEELKCKEIKEGDLLICRLAEPAGRVCIFPKTEDYKSVTSVDVTIYRPDEKKYDRRLIKFLLSTDDWFKQVIEQVGGTTHKRISRGNLGNLKIKLPTLLEEQTRIATILSDMDTELDALEQQLEKARQIKQGMMQELLTGRIRLV